MNTVICHRVRCLRHSSAAAIRPAPAAAAPTLLLLSTQSHAPHMSSTSLSSAVYTHTKLTPSTPSMITANVAFMSSVSGRHSDAPATATATSNPLVMSSNSGNTVRARRQRQHEQLRRQRRQLHVHSATCSRHGHVAMQSATSLPGHSVLSSPTLSTSGLSSSSGVPIHDSCPVTPKKSFYQRPLPSSLLPFASNEGRKVFREALNGGGMEGYFSLAAQFQTQSEPAYCGPTTLAMILNSLALDPRKIWKGGWRWYSEEMLDSCDSSKPKPLHEVDSRGMSFEEFWFMAECNGAAVQAFRPDDPAVTEASFRASLHAACTRTDIHMVASFSRAVLGQTGAGHYSPIAGYHVERDMCLILDVARFKYPPYWLPVSTMWKSICEKDPETGRPRGYFLVSRATASVTPTLVSASSIASATAHVRASSTPAIIADHNHAPPSEIASLASAPTTPPLSSSKASSATVYTPLSSTCRIAVDKASWAKLAEHFCVFLPSHLSTLKLHTVDEAFGAILGSLPVAVSSVFTMYTHDLSRRLAPSSHPTSECSHTHHDTHNHSGHSHSHGGLHTHTPRVHSHMKSRQHSSGKQSKEQADEEMIPNTPVTSGAYGPLALLANTDIYRAVEKAMALTKAGNNGSGGGHASAHAHGLSMNNDRYQIVVSGDGHHDQCALASLLLLACPQQVFTRLSDVIQTDVDRLRDLSTLPTSIQVEVQNLREQMGILAEFCICDHQIKAQENSPGGLGPLRHRFVSRQPSRRAPRPANVVARV